MMKKLVVLVLFGICLVACSSTFMTSKFDRAQWAPTGKAVEGIVYYEPRQVIVTYQFTALIDDKGKFLGTAEDGACKRTIQKEEIVVEPNFNEPLILLNRPSPFSSNKLNVSFSNGMITSINSESTPQIPEMIKAVTGLAKEAGVLPLKVVPGPDTACNAAPVITNKKPNPYK
jgi:hypothetical protein